MCGTKPDRIWARTCSNLAFLSGQRAFVNFDSKFVNWEWRMRDQEFRFPMQGIIDTGMLIKAAVLNRLATPTESIGRFYTRISGIRAKGVYYAIERFCIAGVERCVLNEPARRAHFECKVADRLRLCSVPSGMQDQRTSRDVLDRPEWNRIASTELALHRTTIRSAWKASA